MAARQWCLTAQLCGKPRKRSRVLCLRRMECPSQTGQELSILRCLWMVRRYENASVEFDEVRLAPTYRLLWGIPGRSNALSIAERLGLDQLLVSAARARLGRTAAEVNETISELEALRQQREADEAAAEEARKAVAAATGAARKLR